MRYSISYNRINSILNSRSYSPFIINNIIVPHGITDISHSLHTNNLDKLLGINLCSYFFVNTFSKMHYDIVINFLFLYLSIIHFKDDFFLIKKKSFFSTIFVLSLLILNNMLPFLIEIDIFLLYMSFIHVPLHYRKNWFHIEKKLLFNFFSIISTCIISNIMFSKILSSQYFLNFIKSIVIAHIIYNEKYNYINSTQIML